MNLNNVLMDCFHQLVSVRGDIYSQESSNPIQTFSIRKASASAEDFPTGAVKPFDSLLSTEVWPTLTLFQDNKIKSTLNNLK